ncbi:MAG TPA: thiamine pyrophosphate-binding protein [Baekduia sp.]|uniref:thiamine pyrophosphate-binding protein n=1 Tax=Baekduia sp. TaxID=2600305 RepID=UPI002D799609|nr:thiamine pyrophosphate-binding protein [Baekduia sp.]HET6506086.1 thiamine pyrophosphate-binding protein [Baekduia sp.]
MHPTLESVAGSPTVRLGIGAALTRLLVAAGVREVFGIPAGKLAPWLRSVGEEPSLRHVGVRHEAAASWMAAAIHASTGRVAVAYSESGPGSHNLVSGLGSAYADNLAVLVVTSGVPTHVAYPFDGLVMETDNTKLFAASTKWGAVVRDPARLPALVHRALREALAGRPGPVHLEIPADVLTMEAEYAVAELDAPLDHVLPAPPASDVGAIARAADLLAGARRPLVIAGGGVARAQAEDEVRALGLPTTATQMGLGVVSTEDPRFFGHGGLIGGDAVLRAVREADVVLAVGCRLSSWWWEGSAPPIAGALIHVDVDPQAIGRLVTPEVGIVADARGALRDLVAALAGRSAADPAWLDGLVAEHRAARAAYLEAAAAGGGARDGDAMRNDGTDGDGDRLAGAAPLHPATLADAIGRALPDDALVVYDGAHTSFFSNDLTPATAPRTRFHEPGMGHLGFGLPYANALALAHPGRPVINITGDGAFGFTLTELDTARRHGLPTVTIIHNNSAWGVIRLGQERGGFELGTDLEGTDHVAIARAFGCHAERIERADEVAPALRRALASGRPAVIDVPTRLVPHPGLPRFGAAGSRTS